MIEWDFWNREFQRPAAALACAASIYRSPPLHFARPPRSFLLNSLLSFFSFLFPKWSCFGAGCVFFVRVAFVVTRAAWHKFVYLSACLKTVRVSGASVCFCNLARGTSTIVEHTLPLHHTDRNNRGITVT